MGLDFTEAGYAQTNASFHLRTPIAKQSKGFNHLNISYISIVCMYFDRGNYKFQGFIFRFRVIEDLAKKNPNLAKLLVKEKQKFPLFCQKIDQICGEKNSDRLQVPTQYQCELQFYHLWVGNIKSPVGLNKKNPLISYLFVARVNLHPSGHNC
jgi:hypothetical protein